MMGVAVGGATAGDVVRGALGVEGVCRRGVAVVRARGAMAVRAWKGSATDWLRERAV